MVTAASTGAMAAMMAAAASIGAAAVVAAVTAPTGAAAVAAAGATPAESTTAAAARAARVFLLWLPSGRPCLRDTGGVAAGSFTLFLLPSGRPRFRPLELQSTTWWGQKQAGKGKELLGRKDAGTKEWEKPLESSEALKEDEV
jgi:hypothetical protein